MSGTLRLSKLQFRAGAVPGAPPLVVSPGTVTVFVGPNNGGKSLSLREIEAWCLGRDSTRKAIDSVEAQFEDDPIAAEELLREFETEPPPQQTTAPDHVWIGLHTFRSDQPVLQTQVSLPQLREAVLSKNVSTLRQLLLAPYTVRLDGRTRFSLSDPKPTGDLQSPAQNHLWALFKDDAARRQVREMTAEAFGLHFVVDPTGMQTFRIRMSPRPPKSKSEEQSLDDKARKFHRSAQDISELSDGVQAFVGLVSAVLSLPHRVILVDEPEAFLHPSLARRLGTNLSRLCRTRTASLLVATHSAEFLMGCLEAAEDTAVVRLTYQGEVATARALEADDLSVMLRDPLLRSTRAVQALFHRAAIVTEADADRAFYDEMNRRLGIENRGIRDAIFLNAQNKQTIHKLVRPLRRIGIPAAAVVDLDLIRSSQTSIEQLFEACQVDATRFASLYADLTATADAFSQLGGAIKKPGLAALPAAARTRAQKVLTVLGKYGLFIVPSGELESFLGHLSAMGHGPNWLIKIFTKIGQTEDDQHYLRPGIGDVWEFLDSISAWVDDPGRLGTH